jgi:valyl-tRNA synthetase
VKKLQRVETTGALSKTENHLNKVGTLKEPSCYRTKVIRPMVLENGDLVKPATNPYWLMAKLNCILNDLNTYAHWLNNIRD